jgi:DHA1 family multidrug resistance protein-like MFS transporter
MTHWKRNLVVTWTSQFFSIMGFTFALPFAPFYFQSLGVTDPDRLKVWVAAFAAAAPLSLAVFQPLWGWMADRYGRRPMLLRANMGAAVFLCLMGAVHSPGMLLLVRTLQGVLTGTVTAAQTMVASQTPRKHNGFALGALSSGVFSGAMAGSALGGIFADAFGYRGAFFVASSLVLMAGLLVVFGTTENFVPPPSRAERRRQGRATGIATLRPVLGVLLLVGFAAFVRRFDNAFIPLLVQEIHGGVEGASRWTGALFATTCLAGFLAGLSFGRLADRLDPVRIGMWVSLCGGACMLPVTLVYRFPPLFALRFLIAFCAAGLEPLFLTHMSRRTPADELGFAMGWAATARALGWAACPLLAGAAAFGLGIRGIFFVGAVLFAIMAGVIYTSGHKELRAND